MRQVKEVMSTEQPCDLAYDFGDGHLDLEEYPQGFPRPGDYQYFLKFCRVLKTSSFLIYFEENH